MQWAINHLHIFVKRLFVYICARNKSILFLLIIMEYFKYTCFIHTTQRCNGVCKINSKQPYTTLTSYWHYYINIVNAHKTWQYKVFQYLHLKFICSMLYLYISNLFTKLLNNAIMVVYFLTCKTQMDFVVTHMWHSCSDK